MGFLFISGYVTRVNGYRKQQRLKETISINSELTGDLRSHRGLGRSTRDYKSLARRKVNMFKAKTVEIFKDHCWSDQLPINSQVFNHLFDKFPKIGNVSVLNAPPTNTNVVLKQAYSKSPMRKWKRMKKNAEKGFQTQYAKPIQRKQECLSAVCSKSIQNTKPGQNFTGFLKRQVLP